MSAPNDKQSKAKSKKSTVKGSTKHPKGKEAAINVEKFRGDGVNFKCKLLGVSEVSGSRGDNMCIEAIKKLKQHIKQTGEHKQKILLNLTLKGLRILDEKSKNVVFEHPVNKISFITHDTDDKKIFGYICSARCKTGHMMYAIKYDKVAGVITATLYELFQAVFKLRQEAANQKKAQANSQSNAKANNVAVSNGPSAASPVEDTNIYEEPKPTPSPVTTQDNTSDGHYKVPLSRPLPPAPYASTVSHDSPQPGHHDFKTNQPQTTDSPATSFPSESFFSASVFAQSDSASDTVSMSSVDIPRKESISSVSSEATSFDTRSLDLKTSHSASTPPTGRGSFRSPESAFSQNSPETGTIPEEDHDYETIPSTDYETIPNAAPKTEKKDAVKVEFKRINFNESFTNLEPFPRSDSLNDPTIQKKPPAEAFGDDDLFKCFGDNNFDDIALATSNNDFPMDDPFAPTTGRSAQESQPQATDAFSSDPFETAFGAGTMSPLPFAPSKQTENIAEDSSGKLTEEPVTDKQNEPANSSDRFQAAFGAAEMSPPPFKPEKNEEKILGDTEWRSAFDSEKKEAEVEDKRSEKSEESKGDFKWSDSFDADFDNMNEKEPQSASSTDAKNEVSWSTAFDNKQPKNDVTFSWDDAFGTPESKDGETKSDFGGISFGDAFASTPFQKSGSKGDPSFLDDSFSSNFGAVELKPEVKVKEPAKDEDADSKNEVFEESPTEETPSGKTPSGKTPSGETHAEDKKESEEKVEESQFKDTKDTKKESKPTLADDEDLSSSSDKETGSESDKVTIPKIVEPISEDQNNDVSSQEPIKPTTLPIQPIKPNQDEDASPNAPPPLPPRTKTTLPALPPRPRTFSSPISSQAPTAPPRPVGPSGRDSPAAKGKRLPPALPPRIDLEMEKTRAHSNPPAPPITGFSPDAFSSPKNENPDSWQVNLENNPSKGDKDQNSISDSKTSADPFGDDFFTDFNLSAAKDTSAKPNEAAQNNQDLFDDPFLAKEGTNDMFIADFGGEDPFADFSSNNKGKNNDPFMADPDGVFPGFSTSEDPFSDVNDPFADKTAVHDDPFGSSTKKDESTSFSFHLSKDSSEGDFTDSFA